MMQLPLSLIPTRPAGSDFALNTCLYLFLEPFRKVKGTVQSAGRCFCEEGIEERPELFWRGECPYEK